ncbi:MAG TPA: glycosyltransferase family 39 protein [Gemmatimonadaceae bacterium]
MLQLTPWASLLIVVLVAALLRLVPPGVHLRGRIVAYARLFAHGPWMPLLIGFATGAATWWVWGSLAPSAVVHDESAYLLQAQLFAQGRFTAPTPPLYHFFEQLYVNLVPAISSKYPPGTSLLIAPGMRFGVPALPIIAANALSGALVFVLARRFAGVIVAMLTWALWATSFPVLYFHAMYLSEVPTSLAWLATWWGIARWRTSGRTRDLAIAALALAYCGITRPLTAVALAIAVGIVMLRVRRSTRPRFRRAEP